MNRIYFIFQGAQKIAPLLQVLGEVLNARLTVFFNCVEKHSEMPQKSFFRLVLEPELVFGSDGQLGQGPMARFVSEFTHLYFDHRSSFSLNSANLTLPQYENGYHYTSSL
jgi:hypothetical protein